MPVVVCRGGASTDFAKLFDGDGLLAQYVEKITATSYRIKTPPDQEAAGETDETGNSRPADRVRIWLLKSGALIAPTSIVQRWKKGEIGPQKTAVAKLAARMNIEDALFVLAVKLPDDLGDELIADVEENEALRENQVTAQIADMVVSILEDILEPLKKIKAIAFKLGIDDADARSAVYTQWFRNKTDAVAAHERLQAGSASDEAEGIASALLSVVEDESTTSKFSIKEDQLTMSVGWTPDNDEMVGEALMGYVMKMAMGGMTMSSSPSDGPIETKYQADPNLQATEYDAAVKQAILDEIESRIFVGHYWGRSDKPHLQVQVDPLEIPNSILTEITYEVTSITTSEGKEILRREERDKRFGPHKIDTSWGHGGYIKLNVVKGTKGEDLGSAKIHFSVTAPAEVVVLELDKEDVGKKKGENGSVVTLRGIERDSVSISYKGAVDAAITAYDTTGGALSMSSGMSGGGSMSKNFNGIVDKVRVALVKQTTNFVFDVDLDLLKGKEEKLPEEPSDSVRVRYDSEAEPVYSDYIDEDFANLKVEWEESGKQMWQDRLFMKLPEKRFSGSSSWKVSLFGKGRGQLLGGSSMRSGTELSHCFDKGELKKVDAAYGQKPMLWI